MPDNEYKETLLEDNTKITNGVTRIALIVESMREMAQSTPTVKETTNLYSTIITVLRMVYNRAKQTTKVYVNGELFELETSDKEKYYFPAKIHLQKVEQVWTIILNNAMDELVKIKNYEDRRIDINISQDDDKITITFEDNAGGINEDIKEKDL